MHRDEMADLLKNLKRDEDYIIKDGKVFVLATPYQLLEREMKGNILPDDIIEKDDDVFVEYNAYSHGLFEALRSDPSLKIHTKKKKLADGSEEIQLSRPQAIAQFGVMASLFNRVARHQHLPKSDEVVIDGVRFLDLFDMALFRLDEFILYMHVYAEGGLRKEMDRVCDHINSKRQMRFTKDGKSYYAWDLIGLVFMGAQMEEFRTLDLKDTDKVSKWYAETVEEINRVAKELPDLMRLVSKIMGYNDTKDEESE